MISQNKKCEFKLINFFAMLYMSIAILSSLFVFKIVSVGPTVITAGALLSPLWYFVADIITEVYGYRYTKRIIWFELGLELFFVTTAFILIQLPSPTYFKFDTSYNDIFSNLPRVFLGSFIGTLMGSFINGALLSKCKIILKGRSFWLRSLASNAIGQFILSFFSSFIDLAGIIPSIEIIKAILTILPIKLIAFSVFIIPTAIIAEMLKRFENYDAFDVGVSYNPFIFNNT